MQASVNDPPAQRLYPGSSGTGHLSASCISVDSGHILSKIGVAGGKCRSIFQYRCWYVCILLRSWWTVFVAYLLPLCPSPKGSCYAGTARGRTRKASSWNDLEPKYLLLGILPKRSARTKTKSSYSFSKVMDALG